MQFITFILVPSSSVFFLLYSLILNIFKSGFSFALPEDSEDEDSEDLSYIIPPCHSDNIHKKHFHDKVKPLPEKLKYVINNFSSNVSHK
jgi:hypothetical protein